MLNIDEVMQNIRLNIIPGLSKLFLSPPETRGEVSTTQDSDQSVFQSRVYSYLGEDERAQLQLAIQSVETAFQNQLFITAGINLFVHDDTVKHCINKLYEEYRSPFFTKLKIIQNQTFSNDDNNRAINIYMFFMLLLGAFLVFYSYSVTEFRLKPAGDFCLSSNHSLYENSSNSTSSEPSPLLYEAINAQNKLNSYIFFNYVVGQIAFHPWMSGNFFCLFRLPFAYHRSSEKRAQFTREAELANSAVEAFRKVERYSQENTSIQVVTQMQAIRR